jgi:SAM-dependent methyltransferase
MPVSREFNPSLFHQFYFNRKGLLQIMKENAPLMKGVMLDFGCGRKPYQSLFNVEQYIGIDFEGSGHNHSNEQIDVFYDGKTIPFPDDHFDSILCSEVFEHLFNLEELMKELRRVLKPGGHMLITCPFCWPEHEVPFDYARYTRYALTDLFTKNGFVIVKQERKGSNIEVMHQMRCVYAVSLGYGMRKVFPAPLHFLTTLYMKLAVFYLNVRGAILNRIIPKQYDLYQSNVFIVSK